MAEVDKVLEAERAIRDIAAELEKMKSAADLISMAQNKIDAILGASSEIINKTGEFVKEGSKIIERIGDYDIKKELVPIDKNIKKLHEELNKTHNFIFNSRNIINTINDNLSEVSKLVQNFSPEMKNNLEGLSLFLKGTTDTIGKKLEEVLNILGVYQEKNSRMNKLVVGLVGANIIFSFVAILRIFQLV